MRTVQSLILELAKFPVDAMCFAYEGEVCGVIVQPPQYVAGDPQGIVHCSEHSDCEPPTQMII